MVAGTRSMHTIVAPTGGKIVERRSWFESKSLAELGDESHHLRDLPARGGGQRGARGLPHVGAQKVDDRLLRGDTLLDRTGRTGRDHPRDAPTGPPPR